MLSVLNRFRLFYALSYAGIGVFLPYLALYLTSLGLSGGQIGLLLAIIPLAGFLSQPLWGVISDVYHLRKKALLFACLGVALVMIPFGLVHDYRLLVVVITLFALMNGSINPLGTALTLDYLERGEGQGTFGSLRLWGSIGFALSSFAVGAWVIGETPWRIIPLYGLIMLSLGLVSMTLPDAEIRARPDWREGLALLKQERVLAVFLFGTLLVGTTLGIVNNYLAIYLSDIQAAGWVIGTAMAISAIAEVPLMANVPAFLSRWGVRLVFVGGVSALLLRWFLYLFITEPLLVLPTQVLHSIAMMALLVVGVIYMDRQLDRRWRASGQALYAAALYGIGPSLGLLAAGQIYQQAGIRPVWLMSALLGLAGTWILNSAVRSRQAAQPQPEGL